MVRFAKQGDVYLRHIDDRRKGCLLVTPETGPDEKVVLIDAGARRNMYNFVTWRFGKLRKRFRFHAAVVTHSDEDHYGGFQPFFDQDRFSFATLHHNGIAERAGPDVFGPADATGRFLTDPSCGGRGRAGLPAGGLGHGPRASPGRRR